MLRPVAAVTASHPAMEGAGVLVHRIFGNQEVPRFDPFLLWDDFGSQKPEEYLKGFPWHPHRGIETVTYMLEGTVRHEDSLGNAGEIGPGDIQWMTAGSGIIHQEMPQRSPTRLRGFQLWVNLPAKDKMMAPRYQELRADQLPSVDGPDGVHVKILCGEYRGVRGPVEDLMVRPEYLDATLAPGAALEHAIPAGRTAFAFVVSGEASFGEAGASAVPAEHLAYFDDGDAVRVTAGPAGARVLLVSGMPLREPVSWYGPIVMNTREELQAAFDELQQGTFVKTGGV